jgi:hypothetical protein
VNTEQSSCRANTGQKGRVNMLSVDELLKEGYNLTESALEAIYILPDGKMIDGYFDCGIRGEEHRMISHWVPFDRFKENVAFWNYVKYELQLVMLIPETMTALIGERQEMTEEQSDIVKNYKYKLDQY